MSKPNLYSPVSTGLEFIALGREGWKEGGREGRERKREREKDLNTKLENKIQYPFLYRDYINDIHQERD
jgi:hypothetical protein